MQFAHTSRRTSRLLFLGFSLLYTAIGSFAQTVTFSTLINFDNQTKPEGQWGSGAIGLTPLTQGRDGNLYGTTIAGGAGSSGFGCFGGNGTFFKLTPPAGFVTLHRFHQCSTTSTDGAHPRSGAVLATNGNFYGTTQNGGPNSDDGTVFSITSAGGFATLFAFPNDFNNPQTTDGSQPVAGLVQATDGNFYGLTTTGGTNTTSRNGTAFRIGPTGFKKLTNIPATVSNADGTLIQATDGNFYGTTMGGGTHNHGTVFRLTPAGSFSVIYNFQGSATTGPFDGSAPSAGLIQASDGKLYGTTQFGGTNNSGTIFRITLGGTETVIHSFDASSPGIMPEAALIQASDGNLYGTTLSGGNLCSASTGCGTVFRITPGGSGFTTLHKFAGSDGAFPAGPLVQHTDGTFYGITSNQGKFGFGTIYSLTVLGVGPYVRTVPTSGRVGSAVTILGTDLVGTTAVKFNGILAKFTVASSGTDITTTVPVGALTGNVEVLTPSGNRFTTVKFRVIPTISAVSPTSGAPGASVVITGESFTGATTVAFGGVKASFVVNSYTKITATVPSGAKTGKISVTTAGGTATSSGTFTVL